jgi:hypothetical protein
MSSELEMRLKVPATRSWFRESASTRGAPGEGRRVRPQPGTNVTNFFSAQKICEKIVVLDSKQS